MPPKKKGSELDLFLKNKITRKNQKHTHTRIGDSENNITGGSYSISDIDEDEFWKRYYKKVFKDKQKEYLTEKQFDEGPMLVDIDLQYNTDIDSRQHTDQHIYDLLKLYTDEIYTYVNMKEKCGQIDIFVAEKPNVNCLKEKTKDGIHIIFGIHIHKSIQTLIRNKIVEIFNGDNDDDIGFWELPTPIINTGGWNDVFDEGVTKGHCNWQVYGSRKPNHEAYEITYHYRVQYDEHGFKEPNLMATKEDFDVLQNLKKLSARYKLNPQGTIREEFKEQYTNEISQLHKKNSSNICLVPFTDESPSYYSNSFLNIKNQKQLDERIEAYLNNIKNFKPLEYRNIETYNFTMALPATYYGPGSYLNWIRVGWALANTGHNMFLTWVKMSSQKNCRNTLCGANGKFDWSNVTVLWNLWKGFDINNPEGLSYRSIMYWCKKDAPEKYFNIKKKTIDYFIDETICPLSERTKRAIFKDIKSDDAKEKKQSKIQTTEFDVATVLYNLFKDRFVCVSIKNNIWYEYCNHRWYEIEQGTPLRFAISKDLHTEYFNRILRIQNDPNTHKMDDDGNFTEQAKLLQFQADRLYEISIQLKQSKWKDNIMKECKELFYDKDFMNKLDQDPYLLCFTNGIIDFKKNKFRIGYPDDYVSKCTNIEYVDSKLPIYNEIIQQVNTFIEQLFPDKELRNYMWEHLASTLLGTQENQTFNIYVGSGRNGKSVLVDLMSKVLGDYKGSVPISLITQKRPNIGSSSSEIAQLIGVRYAVMQEPTKGDKINEGIMKEITGGDPIQGRALYKDSVTFIPQFKLVVCTNTLFDIKSNDDGTWRRIRVCDFKSKFLEKPYKDDLHFPKEQYPYQYKLDKKLDHKFDKWAPVFASLLVNKAFQKKGDVADCSIVLESCNEYREGQDYLAEFVKEKIISDPNSSVKKTDLNEIFKEWYKNSYGDTVPKRKELHNYMDKRYGKYRPTGWKNIMIYNGEDLDNPNEPEITGFNLHDEINT